MGSAATATKYHLRVRTSGSYQLASPTTISWRSILFHKYPPGFQTPSSGCTFPFVSVARTANWYRPAVLGVQLSHQVRKEYAPASGPNWTSLQFAPLSVETSTFFMPPYPLKAVPRRRNGKPAGIFVEPSGEMRNDRTGILAIGIVATFPDFISSGVVVPRGVSGIRYAAFIQNLSSGVS